MRKALSLEREEVRLQARRREPQASLRGLQAERGARLRRPGLAPGLLLQLGSRLRLSVAIVSAAKPSAAFWVKQGFNLPMQCCKATSQAMRKVAAHGRGRGSLRCAAQ